MINKISYYWAITSALIIAILVFLFQRRGDKISNLQHEVLANKLNNQLEDAVNAQDKSQKDYDSAINKYRKLRDHYNTFTERTDGRKPQ